MTFPCKNRIRGIIIIYKEIELEKSILIEKLSLRHFLYIYNNIFTFHHHNFTREG